MLNKTKRIAFLTTGLAGALVVSSAAGIALSSCTTTSNDNTNNTPNKFTYSIDWTNTSQVSQLEIDEQGLVYSSADRYEIIAVAPNTSATSFVIPATVKNITGYNLLKTTNGTTTATPTGAFEGLESLLTVTFASNSSLISVGENAFKNCYYLTTINLPSSTSVIGASAFYNCANLGSVNLVGVSYIGASAFQNALMLGTDIQIDLSSATYIGNDAFNGGVAISSVDLSKNSTLNYIGISAFSGLTSLKTINLSIATTLKTISDKAFQNCSSLTTVVLPTTSTSSLTTIGQYAFSGCSTLTQVGSLANTFTAPATLGNYAITNNTATGAVNYVTSGIGAHAFDGTAIQTIDLSNVTVTTPFTVASFKNMTSLTTVNFGTTSKITTIPYSLFEGTTNLGSLTLPASITSIANGVNNPTAPTDPDDDNNSPFYNSGLTSIDMTNITSYATGTTQLGGNAISLTTIVPNKLFQNNTGLKSVQLKTGTTGIGDNSFNGTSSLLTVKEGTLATTTETGEGFLISSTIATIGYFAFQGSGIQLISFANSNASTIDDTTTTTNALWYVGEGAFQDTTSLKTVDLSKAATTGSHNVPAGVFGTGSAAETVIGFSSVSSSTFENATALTTVSLPSSVTNIYTEAFKGNTNLTTVNFDALTSLKQIDTDNFNNTQLAIIDFSNVSNSDTITSLANSFSGSNNEIFTNLPTSAIVKFPAAMNFQTGLSSTSFYVSKTTSNSSTTIVRPSIDYPNGMNVNTTAISGAQVSNSTQLGFAYSDSSASAAENNPMLQYVSDSYNLATSDNGANIINYYGYTFFGNAKLTSLTLSAQNLYTPASSGSNAQQSTTLFINTVSSNNTVSSSDYHRYRIPFGSNDNLTDLTFTNFNVDSNPTYPGSSDNVVQARATNTTNPLYKTTATTWAQVMTIINKFASNSITSPTNWPTLNSATPDSATKINADSNIVVTPSTSDVGSNYKLTISNSGTSSNNSSFGSVTLDVPNNLTTAFTGTFVHNGVTWTLTVNPSGSVTLVGTNINVYKATDSSGNNANQYCFDEIPASGDTAASASKITVTLNIVA